MDILKRHEIFEIEALEALKKGGFLEPLVFGGGTMLRLCFELNRYSTDLDFWFIKKARVKDYFGALKEYLRKSYELTDAHMKFYTLLLEIRSKNYPKRLKIEIRKEARKCDFQERIAFSRYGTSQVIVRALTLEQMMRNKIEAALERKDIRDCFDIEFLLRQGVAIGMNKKENEGLKKLIMSFKPHDYKVTLGSLLDAQTRKYYVNNGFAYLKSKTEKLK